MAENQESDKNFETDNFSMSIVQKIESSINKWTAKYLLRSSDGHFIECVLLRYTKSILDSTEIISLCVSSQIGCNVKCTFCATGKDPFVRNMSTREIIEQFLIVQKDLDMTWSGVKINGIAFMGMGEPLLNYSTVIEAIKLFKKDSRYCNIHFSLSTSGIPNKIYSLADENLEIALFFSLHATTDEDRRKIIPRIVFKIDDLLCALDYYTEKNPSNEPIVVTYLLLKGVNDSSEDAKRLSILLRNRNFKVSLRMYCDTNTKELEPSELKSVISFRDILKKNSIECGIYQSLGTDVLAGCGQLRQRTMLERHDVKSPLTDLQNTFLWKARDMISTSYSMIKNKK